eukprot:7028188-Pyramimonas_sp.AAC.1
MDNFSPSSLYPCRRCRSARSGTVALVGGTAERLRRIAVRLSYVGAALGCGLSFSPAEGNSK